MPTVNRNTHPCSFHLCPITEYSLCLNSCILDYYLGVVNIVYLRKCYSFRNSHEPGTEQNRRFCEEADFQKRLTCRGVFSEVSLDIFGNLITFQGNQQAENGNLVTF